VSVVLSFSTQLPLLPIFFLFSDIALRVFPQPITHHKSNAYLGNVGGTSSWYFVSPRLKGAALV
jgi:hypothetical protein